VTSTVILNACTGCDLAESAAMAALPLTAVVIVIAIAIAIATKTGATRREVHGALIVWMVMR
jgi:hypothetical protein